MYGTTAVRTNGLGNKGFYPVFLFALERLLSLTSDGGRHVQSA
jgi:hypothetical protein